MPSVFVELFVRIAVLVLACRAFFETAGIYITRWAIQGSFAGRLIYGLVLGAGFLTICRLIWGGASLERVRTERGQGAYVVALIAEDIFIIFVLAAYLSLFWGK